MEIKNENFFIGIIISILTSISLFLLNFLKKELILSPYTLSIFIAIIFILFFIFLKRSITNTNISLKEQDKRLKTIEERFYMFSKNTEEKFKIHDRLNKLEVKING